MGAYPALEQHPLEDRDCERRVAHAALLRSDDGRERRARRARQAAPACPLRRDEVDGHVLVHFEDPLRLPAARRRGRRMTPRPAYHPARVIWHKLHRNGKASAR